MVFEASLQDTLNKLGLGPSPVYLREGLRMLVQTLMEIDISTAIDAHHYERNDQRVAYRNGYRKRMWKTQVGQINLRIPKLRKGTYYPDFVDNCEETLLALVHEAYLTDPSIQYVTQALTQIGLGPFRPHIIAQIIENLHDLVAHYRQAPIQADICDLWLDVIRLTRQHGRHRVLLVAIGIDHEENYHALDFDLSNFDDDEMIWTAFIRRLIARGTVQINRTFSGEQGGLRYLARQLLGSEWQYCRPYALQDLLYTLSENNQHLTDAVSKLYLKSTYSISQPLNLLTLGNNTTSTAMLARVA